MKALRASLNDPLLFWIPKLNKLHSFAVLFTSIGQNFYFDLRANP